MFCSCTPRGGSHTHMEDEDECTNGYVLKIGKIYPLLWSNHTKAIRKDYVYKIELGASRIFEQIQMGSTLAARWSANRIAPTAAAWARPRSGSSNHRRVLWEPTSVSADFCQSQLQESKIATCLTVHCKSQRMLCLHTTIGDKYCNELHSSILPVRVVRVIARQRVASPVRIRN